MASVDFYSKDQVDTKLTSKQDTLVSGTNIKTINNQSILGSGDIPISGSGITAHQYSNFGALASDIIAKRRSSKCADCILSYVGEGTQTNFAMCRITGVTTQDVDISYIYISNSDYGDTGKELATFIASFTITPSSTETSKSLYGLGYLLDIDKDSPSSNVTMTSRNTYNHSVPISYFVLYY